MPTIPAQPLNIQVIPGHSLPAALLKEIVALCTRAFEEDMQPYFDTFLGATHVLGYFNHRLVAHALWVTRYLQPGSSPLLRTAYVEAVATEPDYRCRGFASAVMRRIIDEIQEFDLAGLSPFSVKYYNRLGWELWRGSLFVRKAGALLPSPADEQVMIYRLPKTPPLDLSASLSVEWRAGEVW